MPPNLKTTPLDAPLDVPWLRSEDGYEAITAAQSFGCLQRHWLWRAQDFEHINRTILKLT
jgi:hypothetical protein